MTSADERMETMSARPGRFAAVDGPLPPGPRLPAPVQSAALMRFRHSFVPALRRRYGRAFTLRLVPERRALVLFDDPAVTKEIFAGDPEVLHAGKGNAVLGPVMGAHSLLLVDGAAHKRARRLLMPAFRQSAMGGYEQLVTALAREAVGSWPRGREVAMLPRMNALTLEVILRVVFGVADEARLSRLRPLVNATVDVNPAIILGWGYPFLRRLGPWRRMVEVQRELDALLYAEIRERRTAADLHDRTDVLSRLLLVGEAGPDSPDAGDAGGSGGEAPLSDAELRDQLVTLLLAGHETTASALAWALYELARDPALLRRAQAAADRGDDAFLEAVVKESLRLHPIIPMVVRFVRRPLTVGGRAVPAGVSVGPSILLAHRDPASFPEPEAFRPERFVEGEVAPNTWIPFGGGVRRCIGAGFALMEGVAVLREVLAALDLSVVAGHDDVPKVRNITSVPRRGARVVVRPRT